jgi:hypothetical protein
VDGLGDWFIAEPGMPGICEITTDGIINTIATSECVLTTISWPGSALRYWGDSGPATDGRFFQRCRGPGG